MRVVEKYIYRCKIDPKGVESNRNFIEFSWKLFRVGSSSYKKKKIISNFKYVFLGIILSVSFCG